ncbi:MAG: hypothetical protein EXR09_11220 [Acetobacteraceae bacterium]|nr:hypothetical protein [Acetobacteraceae bacterium]
MWLLDAMWSLSTEWQFYVLALPLSCWRVTEWRMIGAFLLPALAGIIWMTLGSVEWQSSRPSCPVRRILLPRHRLRLAAGVEYEAMGAVIAWRGRS